MFLNSTVQKELLDLMYTLRANKEAFEEIQKVVLEYFPKTNINGEMMCRQVARM